MSDKLPACRGFRLWATHQDIDKLEACRTFSAGEISEKNGNVRDQFSIFGSDGDGSLAVSRAANGAGTIQPRTASGERRRSTAAASGSEPEFSIPAGTRLAAAGRRPERRGSRAVQAS